MLELRPEVDVKEVQQQLRDLAANQTRQQYEIQLLKERHTWEHEREDYERQIADLRKEIKRLQKRLALHRQMTNRTIE